MNTPESGGITRREVLKRSALAAASGNLRFPIGRQPQTAIPQLPKGMAGALNMLEEIYAEHSLFDFEGLQIAYDNWSTDPEQTGFITEMMEKYGLIEKGEKVTHATWKRVLKQQIEFGESMQELEDLHERIGREEMEVERRQMLCNIAGGIENIQNSLLQVLANPKKRTD